MEASTLPTYGMAHLVVFGLRNTYVLDLLIVFSAPINVLETVLAMHSIKPRVWFGVETSIVALFCLFMVEYIVQCLAWSATWMPFFSWIICECPTSLSVTCHPSRTHLSMSAFYGVIDLLSVLPYYLSRIGVLTRYRKS